MSIRNKNYLVVIAILFVACLFVIKIEQAKGKVSSTDYLSQIPLNVGQWQGQDIGVSNDVYEILETKDVIIRQYFDKDGDSVVLAVVYSGKNRDSFHPPEYCYLGDGVQLLDKGKEDIFLTDSSYIRSNKLVMQASGDTIKAWYWYSSRDRFFDNYYFQQVYFLLDALLGKTVKGALIRVSVQGDSQAMEGKAKSFIKEVIPILEKIFQKKA